MPPKDEDVSDQDILRHSEDFREHWLEYHEDRLVEQRVEFFRKECCYCGEDFPTALKCFCHERSCQEGSRERYICRECGVNFEYWKDLKQHGKRHKKPGGFFCFSCDAQFTSASARIEHRIASHRIYQCQICLIKYKSSTDYTKHILITHSDSDPEIATGESLEVVTLEDYGAEKQDAFNDDSMILKISLPGEDLYEIPEDAKEEEIAMEWIEAKDVELENPNEADIEIIYRDDLQGESSEDKTEFKSQELMQKNDEDWPKNASNNLETRHFRRQFICSLCKKVFQEQIMLDIHRKTCNITCAFCNKNFLSKWTLKKHFKSHKTKDSYSCKMCKQSFSTQTQLKAHTKEHKKKSFPCDFCEQSFTTEDTRTTHLLFRHRRAINSFTNYSCHLCACTYSKEMAYVKHMLNAHGIEMERPSGTYSCNYCTKANFSKEKLEKHMQKIHYINGKMQAKCKFCGEYFDDMPTLLEHKMIAHRDKFTCQLCNKTFSHEGALLSHKNLKHTEERTYAQRKYLCGQCGKGFMNKTAHRDHEQSNCGKSPQYQCDICEKKLATLGSMKQHKLTHTDIKSFQCSFCEKSFRNSSHVQRHERTHTGEKPFLCTYCSKAFSHRETLNTHLTSHTGIKRFMCTGCGQRFACISNLQAHRRNHAKSCGLVPNCTKAIGPVDSIAETEMQEDDLDY